MTAKKDEEAPDIETLRAEIEALEKALAEARGETSFGMEDAEAIGERLQEGLGDIQKQIDAHPVPSALLAFGLGFLIGRLLAR
jgi:capsule polysaccharide export protein KpsE/RkpR